MKAEAKPAGAPRMDATTGSRARRALEDPSGRRLRRLRWVGRLVAVVFLLWFAVILLGALGLGPAGRVPFGNALRPSAGPPPLDRLPAPRQPARSDLVPALPATAVVSGAGSRVKHSLKRGRSASAPGHTKPRTTHGRSASAPGHTTTTKTKTTHGRSPSAPGHTTTTTTTTPGRGHGPRKP